MNHVLLGVHIVGLDDQLWFVSPLLEEFFLGDEGPVSIVHPWEVEPVQTANQTAAWPALTVLPRLPLTVGDRGLSRLVWLLPRYGLAAFQDDQEDFRLLSPSESYSGLTSSPENRLATDSWSLSVPRSGVIRPEDLRDRMEVLEPLLLPASLRSDSCFSTFFSLFDIFSQKPARAATSKNHFVTEILILIFVNGRTGKSHQPQTLSFPDWIFVNCLEVLYLEQTTTTTWLTDWLRSRKQELQRMTLAIAGYCSALHRSSNSTVNLMSECSIISPVELIIVPTVHSGPSWLAVYTQLYNLTVTSTFYVSEVPRLWYNLQPTNLSLHPLIKKTKMEDIIIESMPSHGVGFIEQQLWFSVTKF